MTTTPEALADAAFENWNAPDLWSGKDDSDLQDRRDAFRAGYLAALRSAPAPSDGAEIDKAPAETAPHPSEDGIVGMLRAQATAARCEALEEAAKVAERLGNSGAYRLGIGPTIPEAIRSLKENDHG